jgi:flagellar basal-body rod modification protein FlgD
MIYQATNLVGKNVVVSDNQISLVNGQATFGVQLPSAADTVNVSIMNSANQVVDVLQLGAHSSGSFSASWNGHDSTGNNAPAGSYSFQVQATNAGQPIVSTPTNSGVVNGISQSNGSVMLNLSNNTSVNASSLLQIN